MLTKEKTLPKQGFKGKFSSLDLACQRKLFAIL